MMTEVHTVSIVAKNRYSAKEVAGPTRADAQTKVRKPLIRVRGKGILYCTDLQSRIENWFSREDNGDKIHARMR
jgi:hypothetical protein